MNIDAPANRIQELPLEQSLSLDFSVTFDVEVFVAFENIDMVIGIFDTISVLVISS